MFLWKFKSCQDFKKHLRNMCMYHQNLLCRGLKKEKLIGEVIISILFEKANNISMYILWFPLMDEIGSWYKENREIIMCIKSSFTVAQYELIKKNINFIISKI